MATDTPTEFERWVAPYMERMALIAARFGPPGEREDVLQEALLRAWQHRASFDARRGSLGGWLFAITANAARTRVRGWKAVARAIKPPDLPFSDPDQKVDLEGAIARLSDRQRLAVGCFYAVGLSIAETSQVMGCSVGTVKSTLADARSALRISLQSPKETR